MSALWPLLTGLAFVGGALSFHWYRENRPLLARLPLYLLGAGIVALTFLGGRP